MFVVLNRFPCHVSHGQHKPQRSRRLKVEAHEKEGEKKTKRNKSRRRHTRKKSDVEEENSLLIFNKQQDDEMTTSVLNK